MKNKGYDALFMIVGLPCMAFVLAITLLGIIKPIMETLGHAIYHVAEPAPFEIIPPKPTLPPSPGAKPESFFPASGTMTVLIDRELYNLHYRVD